MATSRRMTVAAAGAPRRGHLAWLVGILVAVLALVALADVALIALRLGAREVAARYQGRIYPRTMVLGLDLGGLSVGEATLVLQEHGGAGQSLVCRDGERGWSLTWQEAGVGLDAQATAQAAYRAGRDAQGLGGRLVVWLGQQDVPPVLALDRDQARQALERVAREADTPPVEASLQLRGDRLEAVPGQPGRAVDVEASLQMLERRAAAGSLARPLDLVFRDVPPQVADAGPALRQAASLLERGLELSAYDVVTDETFRWRPDRATMARWLRVAPAGDSLTVWVDPEAVRTTLQELGQGIGAGRGLGLDEGAGRVAQAIASGGGAVELYLTHPVRSYTVQAGDTLESIAASHGVPTALLLEANPEVQPERLVVGYELAVPSVDAMLPFLPVRSKRIVVSLSAQRMRVFEGGSLRWDWPVSTGIASSPTLAGVFQILSKEDNAYASQWNLWMPHFMGVYRAGPDLTNGIHALPILANGQRLWEGLLGQPASYGCIILGVAEAQALYEWAEVGVPVVIEP